MSNMVLGLADRAAVAGVQMAIEKTANDKTKDAAVTLTPQWATIVATYGASVLLAAGSATLEGRKALRVHNNDRCVTARISTASSTNSVYEQGFCDVEPEQTVTFAFAGSDIPLYARSLGYEVELEVMEA